jgi:hypothetical protein
MKKLIFLGSMTLATAIFTGCSSNSGDSKDQAQGHAQHSISMEGNMEMKSSQEWIRAQPIDVKALDLNQDGYVYQDAMDWNVISDEEGKCPKCGMLLVRISIDDAIKNLKANGYTVK